MRFTLSLCACLGALALQPVAAESEPIIVTATRLAPGLSGASATTLNAEDLERRQDVFIADALARVPGVTISQNGPFGGQASLRLRGAGSEQTLVLIDGVAVNDAASPGSGYNFATLDTANIARVTVLRGAQSTLWGSDAIGGIVSIETKRATNAFAGAMFVEAGSYDTMRGGAHVSGRRGALDGALSYSGLVSDGISKADERDGNRETDPFASLTLDARAGLDVGGDVRLEAFARYADSDTDFDSFAFTTGVADGKETTLVTERQGGLVARAETGAVSHIVQVSIADIERRNFTDNVFSFAALGRRESARYQGDVTLFEALAIAFGAEHERSRADTGSGPARTDITGLFALADWRVSEAFSLSLGARQDDHSAFGDVTTLRAGATFDPAGPLRFRASAGEGFKAPTVFQLTSAFGALPPNGALQPEEAEGYDAGVAWVSALFDAEIGVFALDVTNQIDFAFDTLRYENVAAVETRGVEAHANWQVHPRVILASAYTYTEAKNAASDAQLIRIPEHAASISADWQATRQLGLSLAARYNGDETDVTRPGNPNGEVKSWTRVDMAWRYGLSSQVEVYGRIENIADESYQDVFGYGVAGRSGSIGLRVKFE